jgi:hypothetical protein
MPARRRFQIKYTLSRQAAQLLAGMGGLPMRPLTRAPEHAGRPSARGPLRELGPAATLRAPCHQNKKELGTLPEAR